MTLVLEIPGIPEPSCQRLAEFSCSSRGWSRCGCLAQGPWGAIARDQTLISV